MPVGTLEGQPEVGNWWPLPRTPGGRPLPVHMFISSCPLNIPQTSTTHPKVTLLFFLPSLPLLTDSPALMMVPPHTQSRIVLSLLSLFLQPNRSWLFYCLCISHRHALLWPSSGFYYSRNLLKILPLIVTRIIYEKDKMSMLLPGMGTTLNGSPSFSRLSTNSVTG